ncbi:fibronectin type III domain-containing protein [Clostridium sp. MD294]|uniref:fibronectin type III domain-containing protein n=1 Tax=Clostridium sp. MD294 TaxID=97138 RepID=UPI001FAC429C|nr:fibronectin type III domain-containing protein [Clostridium sp. MD294]
MLERAINGGSFSQVYSGASTSYTDYGLNSSTTRVQYRVKAVNSGGSSSYKTGSSATVYYSKPNVAPTVPSSITVPATVYGGRAFTVSWGKSTDSDGNLSGYKLEKSINGGSTWTQIYQGSSTSTSITLAFGEATQVMFRVRAYDSSGAHSGYKASGTSTVVNNKAPTAPQSITVPLNIYGGKTAVVTWTAATDSDGNLSGYILERSVNSGTYTQIYKGANKSYSDSITKGWNTVQYRVCAYDSYNEKGAYKTAQVRNIINNELPVITTNSTNLGLKTGAFSFNYTVSDQESNKLTVVEKINGVQKKSFTATSGATYTFQITQQEFICILNGTNTLSITATDTDGGVTTKNVTFQKQENEIAFTLKTPFETDAAASVGIMNVVRQIPEGADFVIEACNNAYDTSPTWEDVTRFVKEGRNFILLNEQKTASKWGFSFKVTVRRNTATGEIYISSVGGNFK